MGNKGWIYSAASLLPMLSFFHCQSIKRIEVWDNKTPQPKFSVNKFEITHQPDFPLGLRREISIQAELKIDSTESWRILGYTIESKRGVALSTEERQKILSNDPRTEAQKKDELPKEPVFQEEITPVFERTTTPETNLAFKINFVTGGPTGHNIFRIKLATEEKVLYWYRLK